MPRYFYTGTDAELLSGSSNFSTLISEGPTVFGLTAAQATAYATLNTAYQTAYAVNIEPSTRTKVTVQNKNMARAALVAGARQLSDYIIQVPTVTDGQLVALGLPARTARTPIPAPGFSPKVDFLSVMGRTVRVRLHDSQSTRRGKPEGVNGASVFSHVGATPPANIADWKFEGNTSRTTVDVVFDESVPAGSLIWVTAFWFNNRKQSGPACDPVSLNIAGGGVSMAA